MPEYTTPDTPYNFEVRIKGQIEASNLVHADFVIRNAISFNARLWDAVEDFVIEVQPDQMDKLRRMRNDASPAE